MKSVIAIAVAGVALSAGAQKILIDFGTDNTFRGFSVNGPDANGNNWNSIDSFQFNTNLVDVTGAGTGVNLGFSSLGGTDSFNGPMSPSGVGGADLGADLLDEAGLGDLAVAEAAADYFVNTSFDIFGLDDSTQYIVTLYGGRKFASGNSTTTNFQILSDNSMGATELASVDLNHADPFFVPNRDTVATAIVTPGGGGTLTIVVSGVDGDSGFINAMSIEVIPAPASAALLGLAGLVAGRRR